MTEIVLNIDYEEDRVFCFTHHMLRIIIGASRLTNFGESMREIFLTAKGGQHIVTSVFAPSKEFEAKKCRAGSKFLEPATLSFERVR